MLGAAKQERVIEIARAMVPPVIDKSFHLTFVYRGPKLICIGQNKPRHTHTIALRLPYLDRQTANMVGDQIGLHSEAAAVIALRRNDCSDLVFVNIRIDKRGNLCMSKPCRGCRALLEQVGFKRIYFTNKNGEFEEC